MRKIKFLDYLVIILEISYNLSILKVITFDVINIPINIGLVLFMIICFFIRFKNYNGIDKYLGSYIFKGLILLYLVDVFQSIILGRLDGFGHLVYLINSFFFFCYLCKLYIGTGENLSVCLKPYYLYCYYNVFVILLAVLLIGIGAISATSNLMAENSLISTHTDLGGEHYFPGYLSLSTQDARILADYDIPMLTGLSHEPHVLNYLIIPCFFFVQSYIKSFFVKVLNYFLFGSILVVAMSSTAIICFLITIIIDSVYSIIISKNKGSLFALIAIVILIIVFGSNLVELIQQEVVAKATSDNSQSLGFTSAMLYYIVTPSGLFGYGNLPPEFGYKISSFNIGIITSIMDLVFYGTVLFLTFKLIFTKDNATHYIALGIMYFLLHNLKVNIMCVSYPYFIFIVSILVIISTNSKTKHVKAFF